ncbi:MAG TPA: alanine racemase [Thermoanaerobaculia bacterium]|nr:alanine racemase [Thermoanaerobaculia bacterium]
MESIHDVPTPALVLDLDVLEANLRRMAAKTAALGVSLRPHTKTHKCVEVAERQRALGAAGITVSTLYEARVFADHGFSDITWAFPVILSRLREVEELAARVTLRLILDSPAAVDALEALRRPLHVWLEVDSGQHRSGVDPESPAALELARALAESPWLIFDGLLTHAGHSYDGKSREEIAAVAEEERRVMAGLAERLRGEGIEVPAVSVGSTPGMSARPETARLDGVTEARPGNYVFYDYTQVALGSCRVVDCGVTVLASVVSHRPGDEQCVVDAGALAMSKDLGPRGHAGFGEVFADSGGGTGAGTLSGARLTSLSQEHGIVGAPFPVGTRLRVLPNHSCLTVAQFDEYLVVRGDEVVDRWKIWRGR